MNLARTIDIALIGLGNVNRNFLRILEMKHTELVQRYGLAFCVVWRIISESINSLALRFKQQCNYGLHFHLQRF